MMSVSILKKQMEQLPPEEIKKMLGTAIKGTDRLADEVRTILTYIDAPLALNLGVPMLLENLSDMINNIDQTLHIENTIFSLPEDLKSVKIAITPDALEMILLELLENARKFHPARKPQTEISVSQAGPDFIQVRVTDNGLTLSVEQLQWAWLPYFQGEKDFTGEIPGLGLGFPMVATLIWKSGGAITLRNRTDGPGVIVDLKIPLESTMRKMERSAAPFGS
jgi:K+-sensing histidine kinase KdpD